MKIGILSEPPRIRSPFKTALKQANGLAKKGHEVHFVVQKRNVENIASILGGLPYSVDFLTLRPVPVLSQIVDFFTKPYRYVEGGEIDIDVVGMLVSGFLINRKVSKVDWLIAHSTLSCIQAVNLFGSHVHKIRKVLYLYDMPIHVMMKIVHPNVKNCVVKPIKRFETWIVQNTELFLCTTFEAAKSWHNIFRITPTIVRPGCEPSSFFPYPKKDYILSITSWEPLRNPFFLLDLMENLIRNDLKLVVAGRWQDKLLLKRFKTSVVTRGLQDKVSVVENLSEGSLIELYRGARCMVYPIGAPLHTTALEASAQGTPIIAPCRSEVWKLFEHGLHGFKVTEGKVDSYIDAISKLQDKKMLKKLSHNIWRKSYSFTWDAHVTRLENLLS